MFLRLRLRILAAVTGLSLAAVPTWACPGDCNGNQSVTAADVTRMVALILLCEGSPGGCAELPRSCPSGDVNNNGVIEVGDLLRVIDNILQYPNGCPPGIPTPTEPPSATPTDTPSPLPPTETPSATPSATPSPTLPVPTATPTTAPTATPTFTPLPAVCGNGIVEPGETCDDGNTVTNPPADLCPEDCTIITCTPSGSQLEAVVEFSSPRAVGSIAVVVQYPDGTVQIPGTAADSTVGARVTNRPSGFLADIFDFDFALRVALVGTRAITGNQLFRIQFDLCRNASPPPAQAFRCTVQEANDTSFQPISGVTCSVSLR